MWQRTSKVLVQLLISHDINQSIELLLCDGLTEGIDRVTCAHSGTSHSTDNIFVWDRPAREMHHCT